MTDPIDPPRRRLYRARDESVWALIRQRYLSGETQKALALAYDVPVCTIQKRITREGWSKRAAVGVRPTFGGMAAPRDFALVTAAERWPETQGGEAQSGRHPIPVQPEPEAALSPAEVAERATTAAGRAIAEGRYAEAERLGKLAETMRKQAAAAPRARAPADDAAPDGAEDEEDQTPVGDRPLNCTMNTCAVSAMYARTQASVKRLMEDLGEPLAQDVWDWAEMAEAMGARVDREVAELARVARANGVAGLRGHAKLLLGPLQPQQRPPEVDMFR